MKASSVKSLIVVTVLLLGIPLALVPFAAPAAAQTANGTLTGHVYSAASGRPLLGVSVSAIGPGSDNEGTDSTGRFEFALPAGEYLVVFFHDEHAVEWWNDVEQRAYATEVTVTAGEEMALPAVYLRRTIGIGPWQVDGRAELLTDNEYPDYGPRISDGLVVWYGAEGTDDEVFLYEGDAVKIGSRRRSAKGARHPITNGESLFVRRPYAVSKRGATSPSGGRTLPEGSPR